METGGKLGSCLREMTTCMVSVRMKRTGDMTEPCRTPALIELGLREGLSFQFLEAAVFAFDIFVTL